MIYDDEQNGTRLRPAFELGVGTTIAAGRGYQIRWEVRDNIVGHPAGHRARRRHGGGAPARDRYQHIFSLNVGLDVILEKRRGRRY